MPVEMIVDQCKPEVRRCREETFCYGPLFLLGLSSGSPAKRPRSQGDDLDGDDWVDDEEVRHRAPDE